MIYTSYLDETGRAINVELQDFDALHAYADMLLKAPIDLEYIDFYTSKGQIGTFNLNTFGVL